MPPDELFAEFYAGSGEREVATTMALVRMLSKLLADKQLGKLIVPIIPDEARTFGLEALFRQYGIYSPKGQLYEPVDRESLLYYNEKKNGAILEEGITEAGAMSSFIAAGTAYASHGINMIPFFLFYSMFGFQRVGDLIWAAADARARGFLVGGTAGRTTLPGEGLQHQDGQSQHYVYAVPNLKAYDPCFAYEMAAIVQDGLYRMYERQENIFYYLTMMNETYPQPAMPPGVRDGIIKGLYRFKASGLDPQGVKVHLFGSGAILREAIQAQQLLEEKYRLPTEVWSVTSYKELYIDASQVEHWNRLHPDAEPKKSYLSQCLAGTSGVYVAALDYMRTLPLSIASLFPGRFSALGTDGFGRSDDRAALRNYFEVDARFITLAALYNLALDKEFDMSGVKQALQDLDIEPEKAYPFLT
jgi:pyruvate dehydrogenase E1 component